MARKVGKSEVAGDRITIARINQILQHIEWELEVTRMLLHRLGAGTTIEISDEIREKMKAEVPGIRSYPC
jgi:hypothetical protein